MKEDRIVKLLSELNLNHKQAPDEETWALLLDRITALEPGELERDSHVSSQSADQQLELLSESSEARYRGNPRRSDRIHQPLYRGWNHYLRKRSLCPAA